MNENEQQPPAEAPAALQRWLVQMRLARATELAQSGRLLEAEAVLVQNGELPDSPRELDLLARIAARQGRFDEARRHWNTAMQKTPENEIYRQCVEHLTPARRIVRLIANSQDALLNMLVWATILFVIGALVFTFLL